MDQVAPLLAPPHGNTQSRISTALRRLAHEGLEGQGEVIPQGHIVAFPILRHCFYFGNGDLGWEMHSGLFGDGVYCIYPEHGWGYRVKPGVGPPQAQEGQDLACKEMGKTGL